MSRTTVLPYLGAAAAALLLTGFGLIADEVVEGDTLDLDKSVLLAIRTPGNPGDPLGPPWLEEAARDITALGSISVLTILVLTIFAYLLLARRTRTAFFLAGAVIGGTIISSGLKALFDRPRPDLTGVARVFSASFPSGHATVSAVVYLTLGALLAEATTARALRWFYLSVAGFLTVIIGLTRLYLGVHYPTDVLAGWSIGSAWAIICVAIAHFVRSRQAAVKSI